MNEPDPAVALPALIPLLDDPGLRQKQLSHMAVRSPSTEANATIVALGLTSIGPLIEGFNAGPAAAARVNVLDLLAGIGGGDARVLTAGRILMSAVSRKQQPPR